MVGIASSRMLSRRHILAEAMLLLVSNPNALKVGQTEQTRADPKEHEAATIMKESFLYIQQ